MSGERVAVVGAGAGGMAAAIDLAGHGFDVTVLERSESPGGKMRGRSIGGHSIDTGPTVFTMRNVFEQLFDDAGESLDRHVTLRPLDIIARHAWAADETFDLSADIRRSAENVGELSGPNEARRFIEFCDR